jgi:Mesyanzhinovviridae DNA primase
MNTLDFLQYVQPEGPWWLSANAQIGKTLTEETDVTAWLSANNSNNIYYTINHVKEGTTFDSRPGKSQIDIVNFLHIDIDPASDRNATQIADILKNFVPQPTIIVFSGGGCQALWRINPVIIESSSDIKYVESRNRYLKVEMQGDSTTDISRIFRLPGTINYPNAKKRQRGQEEAKSEVLFFKPENIYFIDDIPSYDIPDIKSVSWEPPEELAVIRQELIDTLPTRLREEIKYAYEKGFRSEPLFYCILSLLEYRIHPDVIYSIILNKNLGVSDSIYYQDNNESRRDPQHYAARQVIRGLERFVGIDDAQLPGEVDETPEHIRQFQYLSQYYIKIQHFSNKCRVLRRPTSSDESYSVMSKEEFFSATSHLKFVQLNARSTKVKVVQTAKEWFDNPNAPHYRTVKFAPGVTLPEDIYNFWQGYQYPSKPGNWDAFKGFILDVLCEGIETHYTYIIKWMANCVQNMSTPAGTALVFYGDRGLGKSFFPTMFGRLFGRHYRETFDPFAKFNSRLAETVLLFGDEANCFGTANEAKLKLMITQPGLEIEYKGIEMANYNNCLHIIIATNPDKAIPAGIDERRFFVLRVDKGNKKPKSYFDSIESQLINGGFSGMLYELLSIDLNDWNSQESMPATQYLAEQKLRSASPLEVFWHYILTRGHIEREEEWSNMVPRDLLYEMFVDYCHDNRFEFLTKDIFDLTFIRMVKGSDKKTRLLNQGSGSRKKTNVYLLPNLDICREQWPIDLGWITEDETDSV